MKINGIEFLIGSDPEMFVFKDGAPISAHGMVEGTKDHPFAVEKGAVQVDGMALEYNTDPASTLEQWEANHIAVQAAMINLIAPGLELKATPTAFFAEEVFNATPKEARILGCEPDYNAYTKRVNPKPNANVKFRTGAGHIHIGWGKDFDVKDPFHLEECYQLTRKLDLWLGMPSVILDKDAKRRELYGKAGCFRPKSYGLEYRTLSNFWVETPELRKWAYTNTKKAIAYALNPRNSNPFWTQGVINSGDEHRAQHFVDIYDIPLLEVK